MNRVKDKVCIITGANGGIGQAIAADLLKEGAKVVFADIAESVIETGKNASDGNSIGVQVDVTKRESIQALIQKTVSQFGRLDIMFNNAGVNKPLMFLDVTEENWEFIMKVNGLGVLLGTQEAAKQMIAQGKGDGEIAGKIINTASIASREAWDDIAVYASSKFAVVAITQSAAKALMQYGITVNGFAPGVVETEMWKKLDQDLLDIGKGERLGQARKEFVSDIIRGRAATPQDIVGTTTFLASSDSDYMTANIIMIDGGKVLI